MADGTAHPIRTLQHWQATLAGLVLTALAVLGARELSVDADLVSALAGQSDGYQSYERFQARFGLGSADEALLIRAPDLAATDAFEALEDLILDLQFTDGVAEVVSLFSVPASGATTPMILTPPEAPLPDRFNAFLASGDVAGALVSADRTAALVHVIAAAGTDPGQIAAALPDLARDAAPLEVRAVGQQAVERRISFALIRDQAVVTPLAILISVLSGALILRSVRAVVVCVAPAICGVLWFTGLLGWVGQPLDPWLATLPTLVMVLAFADTLHLFFASRDNPDGVRGAIRDVLPAAFMTSLTSALALASFGIAGTDALLGLAFWGPVAVGCGFAAVYIVFPLLAHLLIGDREARPARFSAMVSWARIGLARPRLTAALAVAVALALLPALNRAEPAFSLSEHIRESSPLGRDLAFMEAQGLGSASLFVEVADTDGEPGLSQADAARIRDVAGLVLGGNGAAPDGPLQIPERFRAADGLSVALPVLLPLGTGPDRFGEELRALRASLSQAGLSEVTALAGQSLLAHEVVPDTVAAMRLSFYIALAAILIVVAISQRALLPALLATAISALPMLAIETVLVVRGQGMTMTAAFALTVAFGIAVDDTIHFLNRWRLSGGDRDARLADALTHAGPPMIASTLIMTLGFSATVFSATASLPEFGLYVILALWMALFADLGFLPALIRLVKR